MGRGSRSPRTTTRREDRRAITAKDWRGSMTTMRSAASRSVRLTVWDLCSDRSIPRSAAAARASAGGARFGREKPAESTRIGRCSESKRRRSTPAAYGLRHRLPWQSTSSEVGGGLARNRSRTPSRRPSCVNRSGTLLTKRSRRLSVEVGIGAPQSGLWAGGVMRRRSAGSRPRARVGQDVSTPVGVARRPQ